MRRIVVTGVGAVTPIGYTVDETWDSMMHGRGGIGRITRCEPSPYESEMAGEVKDFDPTKYMDRKDARRTDRFAQLATAAASMALTDGKVDVATEPERIGVSIATGVGGLETLVEQVLLMERRGPS